jgi:hypothetical protein
MVRDRVAIRRGDFERAVWHVNVDISSEMALELLLILLISEASHVLAQSGQVQQLLNGLHRVLVPDHLLPDDTSDILFLQAARCREARATILANSRPVVDLHDNLVSQIVPRTKAHLLSRSCSVVMYLVDQRICDHIII